MKLYAERLRTFPHPNSALADGIVDLSDDLRVERLLEAYSFGIFPWPHDDLPTLWFSPEQRGILEFARFHEPRSLVRFLSKTRFRWTLNQAFQKVIEACAGSPRPGQSGTWITAPLLQAYLDFHRAGYAHSLEVWDGAELVGGIYGVYVGGVFCGESMFHRRDNASKMALVKMVRFLEGHGLKWMDIQMVTPAMEVFGGRYISRADFLSRLQDAKRRARAISFRT